jgi:hypothetical protein
MLYAKYEKKICRLGYSAAESRYALKNCEPLLQYAE